MLSKKAKQAFYTISGPLMKANGFIYHYLRAPRTGFIRVHLGPGQKKYLDGWINVDANMFTGKCDVWLDLRNPLPFHDSTIDAFYSHHMIEHLPDLEKHFKEIFRCLKPGGTYRTGGPNGDMAIEKFQQTDEAWFNDFPDKRNSIGGKFENFIFCRQEHLTILTFSFLDELLSRAGFVNIKPCLPIKETHHSQLFTECLETEFESDFDSPHTLIVEAEKPKT